MNYLNLFKRLKDVRFMLFIFFFIILLNFLIIIIWFLTIFYFILFLFFFIFKYIKFVITKKNQIIKPKIWEPYLKNWFHFYLWLIFYYKPYIFVFFYLNLIYNFWKNRKIFKFDLIELTSTIISSIIIYILIICTGISKTYIKYIIIFINKYDFIYQFKKNRRIKIINSLMNQWHAEVEILKSYENINININQDGITIIKI